MATDTDTLGEEKDYVVQVGRNDKQGFPMKQIFPVKRMTHG